MKKIIRNSGIMIICVLFLSYNSKENEVLKERANLDNKKNIENNVMQDVHEIRTPIIIVKRD